MNRIFLALTMAVFLLACQRVQNTATSHSNYRIRAKLDTTDLSLDCNMHIDWLNSSDSSISDLPFHFHLDSAKTLIKSIHANNTTQAFMYATKQANGFEGFIITLNKPLKPFEKISISIDFKTTANDYFRERMLFYTQDFPAIQYFENGRFNPNYQVHANYEVQLAYPLEYDLATSGQIENLDTIKHEIIANTQVSSVPSYGFILMKGLLLREDSASGVKIRSFYFEDDSKWGNKLLDYSKDIIAFYVDTLGFYPQPVLTIIPGYSKPYGGWPVCPNIVGIHRGIDKKKEKAETHGHWIMSHEIGHQYWGFNYILEPLNYPQWFGIGMGIYTDRLYAEKYIPEFNHNLYFSDSYLEAMKDGHNTTIMQITDSLDQQNFDWNNAVLHDKSFSVLKMLSGEMGEEVFFDVLKYCLENYKGRNVSLEMFKNDCERISKKKLDDFFESWFFTNDYLEYQIDSVITSKNKDEYHHVIIISKTGKANISAVEIGIFQDGNITKRSCFDGTKQSDSILATTKGPINKISLDPDLKLLLVNRKDWTKNK